MADTQETGYLSIGEVLGLLLEDFPDVTISKIRFLESQGLISPERTSSGYRKFYGADVELLKVILTEQRSNYLPLRVIKDRLETGEIDPTGENLRPNGDATDTSASSAAEDADEADVDVPSASVNSHPASRGGGAPSRTQSATPPSSNDSTSGADDAVLETSAEGNATERHHDEQLDDESSAGHEQADAEELPAAQLIPGVLLDRAEFCAMVGMSGAELDQLESFGIVMARDGSVPPLYGDDAVSIATPACEFLRAGIDARHLRNWRTSAEREASLFEQLVTPRFRQRNPESHAEALSQLKRLDTLGGALRAAMTKQALRRHFES